MPHALFKILIIEKDGKVDARGFILPQPTYEKLMEEMERTGSQKPRMGFFLCNQTPQARYNLSRWLTPIAEIQKATVTQFFTELDAQTRKTLVDAKPTKTLRVEPAHYAPGEACGKKEEE